MRKIFVSICIFSAISCNKNNETKSSSKLDSITLNKGNLTSDSVTFNLNQNVDNGLNGIWKFHQAILASDEDMADKDKLLVVDNKTIEIIGKVLIVRDVCRSEIITRKISSLNYWGGEKQLMEQKRAFKRAGLILPDSILIIENVRNNDGCELPFSELLSFDDKIISTMYPYIITFEKESQNCFEIKNDLSAPFESKDIKNLKVRHDLQCEISTLEKFRCGNHAIQYYKLASNNDYTYAIFPQDCGDSEFSYFIIFKNKQIIDELIIDKIAEIEINDRRGLDITHCEIDSSFNIHLTNTTWVDGQDKEQYINDEYYFINDLGKFIKK